MTRDRSAKGRQLSRELLVKALYQWQIAGHPIGEVLIQFSTLSDYERSDREHFGQLLGFVVEHEQELDGLIARLAERGVDQLDAVGRGILLLGLAELKCRPDVPTKVVINEAVELAKRYGTTDSFRFVNAVLDKSARELRAAVAASGAGE